MSIKSVAVIDIASNELRLKIAERKKNNIHILEALTYPISLGRDTFHNGKISFEKVDKTASTIKGFQNIMKEYGVEDVRAVATTAVREAENKEYILDQIMVKTGIKLQVIDDIEEKSYVNKYTISRLPEEYMQSSIIVHLGSGNITIAVLENSVLRGMQNIKIGALRLSEIFDGILDNYLEYSNIIKEYLQSYLETLENFIPKNIKNLVITGNEIDFICELCNCEKTDAGLVIAREEFISLYKDVKQLTPQKIAKKFDIALDKAEVFLPSIIVYSRLLKYSKAEKILSPIASLSDALIYEQLLPQKWNEISQEYENSAVMATKETALRFNVDSIYTERVSRFAVKIFDKLKKLHGLGRRERHILEISSILHNVGKFVNVKQHYVHSYNIIKGLDLVGLSEREKLLVATISLFHSSLVPNMSRPEYASLTQEERVLVSKLCAILRISDALNRSHNVKFDDIDVRLENEKLVVTVQTVKDIELEMWAFSTKSKLFEDVYGVKAELKKRRVL